MNRFVLIRKGQVAVSAYAVARQVAQHGFAATAKKYGVGDSTLRKYLNEEGYSFSRITSWQIEHLPGLEDENGATGDVPTPEASPAEPAGA